MVELMVGVFVLLVGILGVMTMADIANKTSSATNARVAATNLAREIVENVRSVEYGDLTPGQLEAELQKKPGLAGAGNPWTLKRRAVTYTVRVDTCTFDDARDGLAAAGAGPLNPCPPSGATPPAGTNEQNPDDFRRVTVTLTWNRDGRSHRTVQNEMVVNPSGSLGPRITFLHEPAGEITGGSFIDFPVTTTTAAAVRWRADDVASGDATGGSTSWTFRWNLGSDPSVSDWVVDGVYTISAQAFDARNIPGDARFSTVLLNRDRPAAVAGFQGGRNERHGGIVDMRWNASAERDVRGYRVYRISADATRTLICDVPLGQTLQCTDANPPGGALAYDVVALDLERLDVAASPLREGYPARLDVGENAGSAAGRPDPAQVTVSDGLPRFTWTQSSGSPIFFRVYRRAGASTGDPTLADRYAVTFTSSPSYQDPAPLSGPATYWFSAVENTFNESPASDPVVYTP